MKTILWIYGDDMTIYIKVLYVSYPRFLKSMQHHNLMLAPSSLSPSWVTWVRGTDHS